MNQSRTYAVITGFFLVLALPTLLQLVGASEAQTMEHQLVAGVPTPTTNSLIAKLKRIKSTYSNDFGGRNTLIYLHSLLHYYLLDQSPIPQQVVKGKEGWLFVGDHYNYTMQQHWGIRPLAPDTARHIVERLEAVRHQLAKRGIRLYVVIAPNAHTIYPEYLPNWLRPQAAGAANNQHGWGETPHDVFSQAMHRHAAVSYIDLRDTLRAAKSTGWLYQKTDTHWNSYGALIASGVIAERIRQDIPTVQPARINNYQRAQRAGEGGDLAKLMMLHEQLREPNLYWIKSAPLVTPTRLKTEIVAATGLPTSWWVGADARQPRLLFFGDSFSANMIYWLSGYFSQSHFLRQSTIDWAVVDAEKPDVVVVEIVERNINWLKNL